MDAPSTKSKKSSISLKLEIKEEKPIRTTTTTKSTIESSPREDDKEVVRLGDITQKVGNGRLQAHEGNPSSPTQMDLSINKQASTATTAQSSTDTKSNSTSSNQKNEEEQLQSAKAEMCEVQKENERLKTTLSRAVKDYQSLQMHFFDIVQQEQTKKLKNTNSLIPPTHDQESDQEPELISLSLGRSSSIESKKDEKPNSSSKSKEGTNVHNVDLKEGLDLGLGFKFGVSNSSGGPSELVSSRSPENSLEDPKEDEVGEQWPPSKILKTTRSGDDEVTQQNQVKKARVSVRARCDTPTMNDGCQWRKYGQKIAKGNPCPRAYYRCTVAPACPVRKQVQRCAENMSILITTYEGTHNHPLPVSATAMASTTSAAASMLLSGSTSSRPTFGASSTPSTDLHGFNFSLSDHSRSRQFYLPNSSISSSPSYPTITLDLTAPSSSASSSASSQFSRLSSNFPTARYPSSTSFNFSSASESNNLPSSWSNGFLNYGTQSSNKNQLGTTLNLGRQPQENLYQSYFQKSSPNPPQQSMTDTIAAATKAITSDPSFRSALAAAITSIVNGGGGANGNQNGGENLGQN